MAKEKKWPLVTTTPFTADGSQFGVVTVADTAGFKTKQIVYLLAPPLAPLSLQVKQVTSSTQMIVGPPDNRIVANNFTNISAYTVSGNAMVGAAEQDKAALPTDKDHYTAIYESDPIVADRVIFVDEYGNFYNKDNPLPAMFEGSISIGSVEVKGTNGNFVEPNTNGSLNVVVIPSTDTSVNVVRNIFGSVPNVVANLTTTIVTYVVPTGKAAILQKSVASGENIGVFTLAINGLTQSILRTHFSSGYNVTFDFLTGQDNGLVLADGDTVTVTILHNRPFTGNFDARIQVFETTA